MNRICTEILRHKNSTRNVVFRGWRHDNCSTHVRTFASSSMMKLPCSDCDLMTRTPTMVSNIANCTSCRSNSTNAANTAPPPQKPRKVTTLSIASKKRRGNKITMVTAYDYPSAVHVDRAGIDIVLVGDSCAMVELGFETTQVCQCDNCDVFCYIFDSLHSFTAISSFECPVSQSHLIK